MTLSIRLNGNDYKNFTSAEAERDMEAACSIFSFKTTTRRQQFTGLGFPIKKGDLVEILVDNKFKIMTGYVNEPGVDYDSETHTISIKGRSKTQDLVDSTVGFLKEYEKVGLFDTCKIVSSDFDVSVIDQVGGLKVFDDIAEAETGQRAFKFLESLARKRQVLLSDNGDGNLVLLRASSELSSNSLQNLIGAKGNNIKSGSFVDNDSNLYHEYIAQSQLSPINASDFETPQDLAEAAGSFIDETIRNTRRYEFYTEETTDSFTLRDRAEWESAVRRARSNIFTCTVQGHVLNNQLWEPNVQHQIDDDFANIHDQRLLKKVKYKYSLKGGSESVLYFTLKDALILQAQRARRIQEDE